MTDLGDVHWILNMEVTCDRQKQTIKLSQSQYIEDILERHGLADCKPAATLMEVNLKLEKLHHVSSKVTTNSCNYIILQTNTLFLTIIPTYITDLYKPRPSVQCQKKMQVFGNIQQNNGH